MQFFWVAVWGLHLLPGGLSSQQRSLPRFAQPFVTHCLSRHFPSHCSLSRSSIFFLSGPRLRLLSDRGGRRGTGGNNVLASCKQSNWLRGDRGLQVHTGSADYCRNTTEKKLTFDVDVEKRSMKSGVVCDSGGFKWIFFSCCLVVLSTEYTIAEMLLQNCYCRRYC